MAEEGSTKAPDFLAHHEGDHVAVAIRDLEPGPVEGGYLRGSASVQVKLSEAVPLGHKFALTDISEGSQVIEYGVCVAQASRDIAAGQYVHTHNVRSVRWQTSIAN